MTDYSQMDHEELAHAADPLNRIVNRDYPILGYTPTDEQVEEAEAELLLLNAACRLRNEWDPHHAGAMGPEAAKLAAEEVAAIVKIRLARPDRPGAVPR